MISKHHYTKSLFSVYNLIFKKHIRCSSSQIQHISKLLIANRGEIACRIMRTAKKMGIQTVAVYSDPDKLAMHVAMADEAYHIGPAASQESYLRGANILSVAKISGAQAIHPGYGFLSENTEFADLCANEKVIFVGPPSSAIRDMGIKSTSKKIMSCANVPVIGGYHGDDQSDSVLLSEARKIGFPVMIKAVRGGGGKGMRIATKEEEFASQLESAKREALKAFGDDVMLLEKFVQRPRHVEVQIFGDHHGNYVYLFERDCSVQRRHQKIIEEAPAPGVSFDIRKKLGEAAIRAAKAVNYVGAGTVEFILDSEQNFYFMEMNTRLQVEHPVTEMITGTDLVEWQLKVAAGEPLPIKQEQLVLNGHSFEARIYAEDPRGDFLPGAGQLLRLVSPLENPYLRIETGVREKDEVSVHYDPMIAKIVVWGSNRNVALVHLRNSLTKFNVKGLNTNVDFLLSLTKHIKFQEGDVHTDFIPEHYNDLFLDQSPTLHDITCAVIGIVLSEMSDGRKHAIQTKDPFSPYHPQGFFRFNHNLERTITLSLYGREYPVVVDYLENGQFALKIGAETISASGELVHHDNFEELICDIAGTITKNRVFASLNEIMLFKENGTQTFHVAAPKFEAKLSSSFGAIANGAVAPMPGVVEKIYVEPGQEVHAGQPIAVLIAMKMEYVIKAPKSGKVDKVLVSMGQSVPKNTSLVTMVEDVKKEE